MNWNGAQLRGLHFGNVLVFRGRLTGLVDDSGVEERQRYLVGTTNGETRWCVAEDAQ